MKAGSSLTENLSIHGVRHVFAGTKFTKIFWSFAILGSMVFLCFYTFQLYQKLDQTPDINVRIAQKFITNIPFPAITVCTPLFAKNRLVNYYNVYGYMIRDIKESINLTIQEQNYLASNIHTCLPEYASIIQFYVQNRTRNDIVNLLDESFLLLPGTIISCFYRKFYASDCSEMFSRVLTDKGFCYSFNLQDFNIIFNEKAISSDFDSYKKILAPKPDQENIKLKEKDDYKKVTAQWSLDEGYIKNLKNKSEIYPEKIIKGKRLGFYVHINDTDPFNVCTSMGNTFSYFIHLPNEIMLPFHQEHYVEFKKRKDITLTAKSYTTDDGMRSFTPKSRGCYFEGEKPLKFFKTYTKALCEFECMTNYTLKKCGCVKFSMPRTSGTSVCTIDKSDCYFEAINNWPDHEAIKDRYEATCGCLKPCNDIKYEVKFEKISTNENVMQVLKILNLTKDAAISRINFMFDEFEIFEYEDYASYKLHNFVADVGGVLGFFLGCSILSLIEIFYFLFETCISILTNRIARRKTSEKDKIFLNSYPIDTSNMNHVKPVDKVSNQSYINPVRLSNQNHY